MTESFHVGKAVLYRKEHNGNSALALLKSNCIYNFVSNKDAS